jgi:PPOX class probable F420-dependent enzyme
MSITLEQALDVAREQTQATVVTLSRDGRPQLSNVLQALGDDGLMRISTTAGTAKVANLHRNSWVAVHLNGSSFWSFVVVEGEAELSEVASAPDDDTVEELVALYRALAGEHNDWQDYREAMVQERRLVLRVRPHRAYGLIR